MKQRRAQYLELDVLFAMIILVAGILLVKSAFISPIDTPQLTQHSQDISFFLSEHTVGSLNQTIIDEVQGAIDIDADFNLTLNPHETIARQAIILYLTDHTKGFHSMLINKSLEGFVEQTTLGASNVEINLISGNSVEQLFSNNQDTDEAEYRARSRALITGLFIDEPFVGYAGTLFLATQKNRIDSYAYFGGFVGQGNMSTLLSLPEKYEEIVSVLIEGSFMSTFNVSVNNTDCQQVIVPPDVDDLNVTSADLTENCSKHLAPGLNTFNITFIGTNLSTQYIGGGFITVTYKTEESSLTMFQKSSGLLKMRRYLPSVTGLFNMYDSFYVPGDLLNMSVYLNYSIVADSLNSTAFFSIGNWTLYEENVSGVSSFVVDLNDTTIKSTIHPENYSTLANKTVPYRFGFLNTSAQAQIFRDTDVVVLTDLRSSMSSNFTHNNDGSGVVRNCDDPQLYDNSTSRLSVAKCANINFTTTIINSHHANRVGLIGYGATSASAGVPPTSNLVQLNNTITGYSATGSAANLCSAIYEAENMLDDHKFVLLNRGIRNWKFNNSVLDGSIPGNWYEEFFDDSMWLDEESSWTAPGTLGFPTISNRTVFLHESASDIRTPVTEFDNSPRMITTYQGANGWYSSTTRPNMHMVFDYQQRTAPNPEFNATTKSLRIPFTASYTNASGFWGVSHNVTDELLHFYNNTIPNMTIALHYDVELDNPTSNNRFWVKFVIHHPNGEVLDLGSSLDSGDSNADTTNELFFYNGTETISERLFFSQDIKEFFNQTGNYTFEFGPKVQRTTGAELSGHVDLYMIGVDLHETPDHYYFRNTFTIDYRYYDESFHYSIALKADNSADVYINGVSIGSYEVNTYLDPAYNNGETWDEYLIIPSHLLGVGSNTVAVELRNTHERAAFDMEISVIANPRQRAILVMSDGDDNSIYTSGIDCSGQSKYSFNMDGFEETNSSRDDAIRSACVVHRRTGLQMYSVAFGLVSPMGDRTMKLIAACDDEENYFPGNEPEELLNIYDSIADLILQESVYAGQVVTSTLINSSVLSNDSYVEYTFRPNPPPPLTGKIVLSGQQRIFEDECNATVVFPSRLTPLEGFVTSYSGSSWSHSLEVNQNEIFNLSRYSAPFEQLGDPFMIYIPPGNLQGGENNISLGVSQQPNPSSLSCSEDSKLLFTASLNSTIILDHVYPESVGCNWTVNFVDRNISIPIPPGYEGPHNCYYGSNSPTDSSCSRYTNSTGQNSTDWIQNQDVWAHLGKELFESLDLDDNCVVDIDLEAQDIGFRSSEQGGIPYLWGPSVLEVSVWR